MATSGTKIEPKTIAIVIAVIVALAFAVWQGTKSMFGAATDVSYTPKVKPPPESARPPGYETTPQGGGEDKTSAGG